MRALKRDGWYEHEQVGSHLTLRHPVKRGRVVVPMHSARTVAPGTLRALVAQAGLSMDEFRRLL